MAVFTVNTALDAVDPNDGLTSLREAILAANAAPGADVVNFAPALSGQTISLTPATALPTLTDHATITGLPGITVAAIISHVIDVGPGAIAQISSLTLSGGFRTGNGGAIANQGRLVLTDVRIRNNVAAGAHGGGIYNHTGAELHLLNSTVTANIAGAHGGGVYNLGELLVGNSTIASNNAMGGQGGGIHNTGRATVLDSTIAMNQTFGSAAAAQGGGVYNNSPLDGISLIRVTLQENDAIGGDGIIGADGAPGANGFYDIFGTAFPPTIGAAGVPGGHGQDAQGGGLYSASGYVSFSNSIIDANVAHAGAGGDGGAGGTGGIGHPGGPIGDNTPSGGGLGAAGGFAGSGGHGGNAYGGGLYINDVSGNQTYLWDNVTLTGNEARGGKGGAGGRGGNGGNGGTGFHAIGSVFNLTAATPGGQGNLAKPGAEAGIGGAALGGGLFYASTTGELEMANSTISANRAISGDGGRGGNGGNGGNGGAGGNGAGTVPSGANGGNGGHNASPQSGGRGGSAQGGGVRQDGGAFTLLNSTASANEAIGGKGGDPGAVGAPGLAGPGGAQATGGVPGSPGQPGQALAAGAISGAGGHGSGGGLYGQGAAPSPAAMNLLNATVAANLAQGADSAFNFSGNGTGGGLYISNYAAATLRHATLSLNHARAGQGGFPGNVGGGGVWTVDSPNASTTLNHTIVARNLGTHPATATTPSDLAGKSVQPDSAFNLIGDGGDGGLADGVDNNRVGVADAMLGPLADNGGATETMAPLVGSPAIDAGDRFFQPSETILLDQRGKPRVARGNAQTGTNDVVGLAEIKFRTAGGQVVTPVHAFASSYWGPAQQPINLINGAGLDTSSGNVMTYTHAPHGSAHGMWAAGNGQGVGGADPVVDNQYLVLELAQNVDLSTAYLWQMVQTDLIGRGIKEFRLYGSPSAPSAADKANPPAVYDLTGYSLLLDTTTLAPGPQSGPSTTQAFALAGATNVRTLYLDVISSYNTGPRIDIGAVEMTKFVGVANGEFLIDDSQPPLRRPTIRFTLTDPVDGATVTPSDVVVERLTTIMLPGGFVSAASVSVDGATITFALPIDMPYGPHKATLPADAVTDVDGNPLLTGLTFDFNFVPLPSADFNDNGAVDGADFLAWQRGLGSTGVSAATMANGNADHDDDIDQDDLAVWKAQFGSIVFNAEPAAASLVLDVEPAAHPDALATIAAAEAIDAAFASDDIAASFTPPPTPSFAAREFIPTLVPPTPHAETAARPVARRPLPLLQPADRIPSTEKNVEEISTSASSTSKTQADARKGRLTPNHQTADADKQEVIDQISTFSPNSPSRPSRPSVHSR